MSWEFLLDEHLPPWWRSTIRRLQPQLTIWAIGDPGAPPRQSTDPLLLEWCEAHDCILLTNNRSTMPGHLTAHVAQGRHVPGIFIVDPALSINQVADALSLIHGASLPNEYQDQFRHLPIT
jgi:hypothetical protein